MESFSTQMGQVKNTVLTIKDKIEELGHWDKDKDKTLRKYEWNMQGPWDMIKRSNLWIIGIEWEEIQRHRQQPIQ